MMDTTITCPKCGHPIQLTDALTGQIRRDIEARLKLDEEKRVKIAIAAAESRAEMYGEMRGIVGTIMPEIPALGGTAVLLEGKPE